MDGEAISQVETDNDIVTFDISDDGLERAASAEPNGRHSYSHRNGARHLAPPVSPVWSKRAGVEAKLGFKVHPHMLRHACGYVLAGRYGPHNRASSLGRADFRWQLGFFLGRKRVWCLAEIGEVEIVLAGHRNIEMVHHRQHRVETA